MVNQPRSQSHPPTTRHINLIRLTLVTHPIVTLAISVDDPFIKQTTAKIQSEMYASDGTAASTFVQEC
jgi:hypothetical protein